MTKSLTIGEQLRREINRVLLETGKDADWLANKIGLKGGVYIQRVLAGDPTTEGNMHAMLRACDLQLAVVRKKCHYCNGKGEVRVPLQLGRFMDCKHCIDHPGWAGA